MSQSERVQSDVSEDHEAISDTVIDGICARLAEDKRIRQRLPGGGILQMDRLLPFLCVYRRNPRRRDEGTARLVMSEASFLCAPGTAPVRAGLTRLVRRIAETAIERLGSFLILEVWAGEDRPEYDPSTGEIELPRPEFQLLTRRPHRPEGTVATLQFALQQISLHRKKAAVQVNMHAQNHPPGMTSLIREAIETKIGCHVLGLQVRPVYRDPASGEVYDRVATTFVRDVSHSLKKGFFAFALNRTEVRPEHYFSLGVSRLSKQVLVIDRQLADLSRQFKFLLLVTPINAERAWDKFSESGFRKTPTFQYRPLDVDPLLLKRRLMKIPTERVTDPTLSYVLRQAQSELDRQISMLADIGTHRFLPGSLQVFEGVKPELRDLSLGILQTLSNRDSASRELATLDATAFARLANAEIQYYRSQSPAFLAQASVRDDMFSGLMVAGAELLIGRETRIAERRADALLQHEVGTHLVTYFNGATQPLRLLQVGLSGYDALQEGLAVLSEYLVGGLSGARLRTLAARVIAVDGMIRGETFVSVFEQLVDGFGFEPRTAYTITMRVFRGGGLTKDALYLQGLVEILDYLGGGGEVEPLLIGKIAVEHVPVVRELLFRGILRPAALRPKYLDSPEAQSRLDGIHSRTSVLDLLDNEKGR
ncbi:flavohemoglobin expression-modulating QEGLA motif protein [Stieleria sp. ICT_E10.1]|nr:flavohemoglobin expression-modulating QEGLA motif protein [Stieleria sedimenti]